MHPSCAEFVRRALPEDIVRGARLLEVGAQDVNGSVRAGLEALRPAEYVGVDISPGRGVDVVLPAERLEARFGRDAFDVVLTTEMLEHVADWRAVVHNLKAVVRPGGVIAITTRAPGFAVHAYPCDYWRYNLDDMSRIFSDMDIELAERDLPSDPGVFLRVRKPARWDECDLSDIRLYSMGRRSRGLRATPWDERVVRWTTAVEHRCPQNVWFGLRLVANVLAHATREHRRSGAGLLANVHPPYRGDAGGPASLAASEPGAAAH